MLVNNAGIAGTNPAVEAITADSVSEVHEVNVLGPVRVLNAFLPLLRRSEHPVVVNVSSGLGSQASVHDGGRIESQVVAPAYCSSKAALNILTAQFAKALPDVKVNCVDPGYTATDLNANSGHQTVQEGTDAIVAMATIGPDGPTGTFVDRDGTAAW